MASTIIDSRIFGDMFSDVRMRDVWSDENRTAKYLDIERALAKVQGQLGIIPQEAADEIVSAIRCGLHLIEGLGGGVTLVGNDGHQLETEPTDQLYLLFTLEFEAGKQEGVFAPTQWQRDEIADLQSVYGNFDTCHCLGCERHTEPYASQRWG